MAMDKELFDLIYLRPSAYKGTTVICDLEFKDAMLYREDIKTANAIDMTPGDIGSVRASVMLDGKRWGVIRLFMEKDMLSDFVVKHGSEHINTNFSAEIKSVYGLYGDIDPYIKDFEVIGFKLESIL